MIELRRSQGYKIRPREMWLTGYDLAVLKKLVRLHWIATPSMQRIYSELERVK
jgi:hypothetical protein